MAKHGISFTAEIALDMSTVFATEGSEKKAIFTWLNFHRECLDEFGSDEGQYEYTYVWCGDVNRQSLTTSAPPQTSSNPTIMPTLESSTTTIPQSTIITTIFTSEPTITTEATTMSTTKNPNGKSVDISVSHKAVVSLGSILSLIIFLSQILL